MKTKNKYERKTGKTFKDSRGWLKKILDGNFSSCIEVFSKKSTIRANHYHKKDKHFIYVISGKILYFYKDRKKSALAKNNMRLIKEIVGSDPDHIELINVALSFACNRVVIKQPRYAEPLKDIKPWSHQILGRTIRYDVYMQT